MPNLFGKETIEGGSLPATFDYAGVTFGTGSVTADATSKVNGTYSVKFTNSTEAGMYAQETLPSSYTTVFTQVSGFLPTGFSFGAGGYCGLFSHLGSSTSRLDANIEDYGTIRLTLLDDTYGYVDTGVDIPINSKFKVEIKQVKNATTGRLMVWLNNDVEGSPDYDSGNINTGTATINEVRFGKIYIPNGMSDYYLDDFVVSETFIGPNSPTPLRMLMGMGT